MDINAAKDADLIILCSPVETIIVQLSKIAKIAKRGALIMDVGSTKLNIVNEASKVIRKQNLFLGAHPLAGLEKKGVQNANAELFKNTICIFTPNKNKCTEKQISNFDVRFIRFWKRLGAKICIMDAKKHDEILAFTSHLPHICAFSLTNAIPFKMLEYVSNGLKDSTRIASSDATIWKDIIFSNKKKVISAINEFSRQLELIKSTIEKDNKDGFLRLLKNAKNKRDFVK